MKLVNLRGLIELVNGCTKPESQPFRSWVSDVIATIQHDGSYSLEPAPAESAPAGGTAYLMPREVADAIVRLEVRNIQADDVMAAFQREQTVLLEQISRSQQTIARSQSAIVRSQSMIAEALQDIARPEAPARGAGLATTATPGCLEGEEPRLHRGHPRGGGHAGACARAGRGQLPLGGNRHSYGSIPRPRPRLPPHTAEARLHAADRVCS
jgi:hypothetical protein